MPAKPLTIEALRMRLLAAVDECTGPRADLLRRRVLIASTAAELWFERTDLFQLLCHQHCESRAKLILDVTPGHLASTVENF